MKFRWTLLATPVAVLAAAGWAQAATVKYPDGTTKRLAAKDTVEAPRDGQTPTVITGDEGEEAFTLTLRKGAVVRFDGTEADGSLKVLTFFLKKGGLEANVGYGTRIGTPAFYAFPGKAGARTTFYAESFGVGTAYARAARGAGLLRLLCNSTEFQVHGDQGLTVERGGGPGEVAFTTDTNNEWKPNTVGVLYPLSSGIVIELNVPKATSGFVRPKPNAPGKTLVQNQVSSWKSGGIQVSTYRGDDLIKSGRLAPGVPATIDNATGGIEFGGVAAVEFSSLKAAVSLTSEFESLATSPLTRPKKH